jgi:hypothetical protein
VGLQRVERAEVKVGPGIAPVPTRVDGMSREIFDHQPVAGGIAVRVHERIERRTIINTLTHRLSSSFLRKVQPHP